MPAFRVHEFKKTDFLIFLEQRFLGVEELETAPRNSYEIFRYEIPYREENEGSIGIHSIYQNKKGLISFSDDAAFSHFRGYMKALGK